MDRLRTRDKDFVFANGRGAAPPQPPAFFLRRAGLLSRASYHEQELVQAHRGYRPFQIPSCMQSICKWWGYVSRSHMDPFRTRDLCLQIPIPPAFFLRCAGLLSKTSHHQHGLLHEHHCSRSLKPIMLAVHLQTGGLRPPQPPHFFKLYKATASIILSAKQNPYGPFQNP